MKRNLLFISVLLFLVVSANAQQPAANPAKPYKFVIKGGHIIDFKNNIDGVMDIAIKGGRPASPAMPAEPERPASNGVPARPARPAQEAVSRIDGTIALVPKILTQTWGFR